MRGLARSIPFLLSLGAAIAAIPAAADESETVTAVYHGAEDTAENAGAVASVLALLDPPVTPGAPPAHLDRHFPPGEIQVFGAGVQRCTGGPTDVGTYRELLADLYRASMALEETDTIEKAILAAQPCVAEPLGADLLARVHYLDGVSQYDLDAEAASVAFRAVHAIDLDYPWDDSYPPNAQGCFLDAKAAVLEQAKVPVTLYVPEQASAWLDGGLVPPGTRELEVYPGRHLVQFQETADGALRSLSIEVAAETPAVLFDPVFLTTAGAGAVDDATAAFIRHLAAATDAGVPDYVVALGPEIVVWRWSTEADALERIEVPSRAQAVLAGAGPEPQKAPGAGPHPAVPILIGAGAGLMAMGAILSGTATSEFNEIWADYDRGTTPESDYTSMVDESEALVARNSAGIGLLAGGGVVMVVSIPVGVLTARGKRTEVSAAVQLHADPGAAGIQGAGLQGATLTLGFRPVGASTQETRGTR